MNKKIFISFKYSDENGAVTKDYSIAKELYLSLEKCGFTVFFSPETMEKNGVSQYKKEIDNALDETNIMIVVLTKVDYAFSHWVNYEYDSFYSDFLSGLKKDVHLFTLTDNVDVSLLPRTLRNVQNFDYKKGIDSVCEYINNTFFSIEKEESKENKFTVITGKDITFNDIKQAVDLDLLVYDDEFHVSPEQCFRWFDVNPDIYVMIRSNEINKIVGYVNISPVTDDCYEKIKNGHFIDTGITEDMILSYDMPYPYSVYFSSVVIHPNYQNSELFMILFNAIVDKFIYLSKHEVYATGTTCQSIPLSSFAL